MNLKETILAGKKLTHNSPLRKELFLALKNFDIKSYSEAIYFYINNLKEIPKCSFSNENQYFDRTRYVGCSKTYYTFIKHDSHIIAKWLSWENLFKIGLSINQAKELKGSKSLVCARLSFPYSSLDKEKIREHLKNNLFLDNVIDTLLNRNFNNINDVIEFINLYKNLISSKNNTLLYYTNRGYDAEIAKEKLYDFFNTWEKFKNIDKESERYKKWLESRKIGLNKVRTSLRSKFEKKIYEELKNDYDINLKYCTNINSSLFSVSKFKHDFFINNKLIVEYNGSYWHKDMFSDKRFDNINVYKLELYRAKISIDINNLKYLILWESDINGDMALVKKLIEKGLNNNELFYSSRDIDIELFNKL